MRYISITKQHRNNKVKSPLYWLFKKYFNQSEWVVKFWLFFESMRLIVLSHFRVYDIVGKLRQEIPSNLLRKVYTMFVIRPLRMSRTGEPLQQKLLFFQQFLSTIFFVITFNFFVSIIFFRRHFVLFCVDKFFL